MTNNDKVLVNAEGVEYIIGESPLDVMKDAVRMEYENGIKPKVGQNNIKNIRNSSMERYASLLVIYAVNKLEDVNIEICPDGCRSDLLFYYKDNLTKCMGIQVKTTSRLTIIDRDSGTQDKKWVFSDTYKNYSGLLMYLRCLEDGESWLIPHNILSKFYKGNNLYITAKNTKTRINWGDYKVKDKDLAKTIYNYYYEVINKNTVLKLETYDNITRPISADTQKEHQIRKNVIPILLKMGFKIEKPHLEDMSYDFIIGNLRIQEKRSRKSSNHTGLSLDLCKNDAICYTEQDFDILLIHNPTPHENLIYFIPTDNLKKHKYLKTENWEGIQTVNLYPCETPTDKKRQSISDNWAIEFLCSLDDPNLIQRLIMIYYKQYTHSQEPVVLKNPELWNISCKNLDDLVIKWNLKRTYAGPNSLYTYVLDNKRILKRTTSQTDEIHRVLFSYTDNKKKYKFTYNDFDFVYTKIVDKGEKYFYMIPSICLRNRNILSDNETNSRGTLKLSPFINEKANKNYFKNLWANDFLFRFDDENIANKILNLLNM